MNITIIENMNIGIISNLYPPYQRGGAEYVVVRTVESLLDREQDVFVVTGKPFKQRDPLDRDRNSVERVYRFSPRNLYFTLNDYRFPWFLRLIWHVVDTVFSFDNVNVEKVLFREKPDVVLTHNMKGLGLRIPRVVQCMDIPHIHIMHDLQLIYPSGLLIWGKEQFSWMFKPAYSAYRFFTRRAIGRPDLVVFPSKFLMDKYKEFRFFKDTKTIVMPNPAPAFDIKAKEGRLDGPLRILFVGQLERHKGIKLLISAFKKLEFKALLNIAGEGTERKYLVTQAKANKPISDLGYVSVEQLIDCLKSTDVIVVPSLCYENSPTVIYEALTAGVPVIAADIGGVGELVQDGVNGYLFKPGDVDDLADKLRLMNDQKEEFGHKGLQIKATIEDHSLDNYADKLMKLIDKVQEEKK